MIKVENLAKSFKDVVAVNGVSFEAQAGEIFGLLGPNGAGKTTTLNCMCGLLVPTSGSITIMDHDAVTDGVAARRVLGVVPQEVALYEELSARQNLAYWGGVQGMRGRDLRERVDELLELAGLSDRAKEPIKGYSGGMRRRLNFVCGILHRPKVLLLDEPTVGVDPQSRVRLLDLVREQAAGGACVLYTTHYMEEAETLCDRLAIIDHGKLIAQGTMAELRAAVGGRQLLRLSGVFAPAAAKSALEGLGEVSVIQAERNLIVAELAGATKRLPAVLEALSSAGAELRGTTLTEPSLESLFIKLTGKELRE